MTTYRRARRPEQKEARRAHLLATTRAMLEDGADLRTLSLNELARRAGMAKSNVYRYFETREAVLLALLWEELAGWRARLDATLRRSSPRRVSLEALVHELARTLAARPMLCALVTALPSVLEHNLAEATIRAFKRATLAWMRDLGRALAARAPALDAEAYVALLHDGTAVIAGLYPAASATGAAARVNADPSLKVFQRHFRVDLERFLLALARDRARATRGKA